MCKVRVLFLVRSDNITIAAMAWNRQKILKLAADLKSKYMKVSISIIHVPRINFNKDNYR